MSAPSVPQPQSFQAVFGMEPDQEALRAAVRAALIRFSPALGQSAGGAADVTGGLAAALGQLGLCGALVPERFGGAGLNFIDVVVALEEVGRLLVPTPLLSTTLAVSVLLDSGDEAACARHLPGLAAGETTAACAVAEKGDWSVESVESVAVADGDGYLLSGSKHLVLNGASADVLLVAARHGSGVAFFAVETGAPGLTRRQLAGLDPTRELADLELDAVRATRLGSTDQVEVVQRSLDVAVVLGSAEQIGAAQQALDLTVDYAKTRVQYGRLIGSFQAIKHLCADTLIEVEYARAAAYYAGWAATSGRDELGVLAGVLKATVAEASVLAAKTMIQVHGGIGFAWEHPAHLYYKRAVSDRALFGSPDREFERTARLLGI